MAMIERASDNFNRADENPLDNGNWSLVPCDPLLGYLKVYVNECQGVDFGKGNLMYWTGSVPTSWHEDQYSQIGNTSSSQSFYCLARVTSDSCYFVLFTHSWLWFYKLVSGSSTLLGSAYYLGNLQPSDTIKFSIEDNGPATLKAFLNGAEINSTTDDSGITSGRPGVGIYDDSAATLDNWSAGDKEIITPSKKRVILISWKTSLLFLLSGLVVRNPVFSKRDIVSFVKNIFNTGGRR